MNRFRFSLLTLNLWNTERWDERERTVTRFLSTYDPDICCFQELRESTAEVIESCLKSHDRVRDPFAGWLNEGNIFFRRDIFREAEHGAVDLSMPERDRRLFWVRLRAEETGDTLLVSTVHLTHQGNADEMATGVSYRHTEAKKIASVLPEIVRLGEPAFVCGDFNDPIHPARILAEDAGFSDAFLSLGLLCPPTFPSQPVSEEIYMTEAIDRIMFSGPLRPLVASVPNYYAHGISVSDHWPVIAVFETHRLAEERNSQNKKIING